MDRLLNVKEAAKFLNVSEMSIRRWTNKGSLKCFRVGGKKERRFYMDDLVAFLHKDEGQTLVLLGFDGMKIFDGSHVTHFYSKEKDFPDASLAYVLSGLTSGEKVLVVMPPEKSEDLLSALATNYSLLNRDLKDGRLIISQGKDSPKDMIRFLKRFAANVDKFRVLGDMSWAFCKGWDLETLRELEQAPELRQPLRNGVLVCQYGLEEFSGDYIMMAAEAHEQIIYKNELRQSPYFRSENKGRNYVPVI